MVAFTTKKDFSFLGAILKVGGFLALGVIAASLIFGFQLGVLFSAVMVLFAVGYPLVVQIALITELLLPMPDFLTQVFEELLGAQDQAFPALVLLTVIAPLWALPI